MDTQRLVTYTEAMKIAGLSERTFFRRLASTKVPTYIHGRDRRRRLIRREDLPKLIEHQEVERGEKAAA